MPQRVFVTGMGLISSIGDNIRENYESLRSGRYGIGELRHLDTQLSHEIPAGEVKHSHAELFLLAGLPVQEGYSRNALLGLIAAREAHLHAKVGDHPQLRTGLISATTVGGMDQCEKFYPDFLANDTRNVYIDAYDCADSTEKIADLLGVSDFVTTLSTACSSAANALMLGARMIRSGRIDRVIAGGCESLTKFHLNGFNALKILDKEHCKPFDAHRAGINLGEGAAYLVLESEEALSISGNEPICELVGWGNACEAFHQTASSPDGVGAYLAMKKALEVSGLQPSQIDYINAHGTGTDNNDISEGNAIERLFGSQVPLISSTKPFTGHTTSAAGSTEAILSIFCIQHGVVWPNLNFRDKIQGLSFTPVQQLLTSIPIHTVMTNSFGFGGNDTSLIFTATGKSIPEEAHAELKQQ